MENKLPKLKKKSVHDLLFRPVTHAWEGGCALSKTDVFVNKMCVTKAEYDEHGKNICREKFDS